MTPYESDWDIQVIPDGEEELHYPSLSCGCCPQVVDKTFDERPVVLHTSYDGREVFDILENTYLYTVRQKHDC